ncbi:MAG: DUF721 domain-containing protein [Kiritimatiellae bacterium]|nr:DUF721 domain-containing protein [Kiritimatiellia bacterium]
MNAPELPPPSPRHEVEPQPPADPCRRPRRRLAVTASEWQVARERFRIGPDELPPSAPNTAPPISKLMADALASLHLPTVQQVAALAPHWAEIVGAELARHSRPARMREGTLYVAVDHPLFLARFRGGAARRVLDYVQTVAPELQARAVQAFVEG